MKAILVALFLLPLAGCLSVDVDEPDVATVPDAFQDAPKRAGDRFYILTGSKILLTPADPLVEMQGMTEAEETQLTPGGGQAHTLSSEFPMQTFRARLESKYHNASALVDWYETSQADSLAGQTPVTVGNIPENQHSIRLQTMTSGYVHAVLRDNSGSIRIDTPGHIAPIFQWTVHGRVYPSSSPAAASVSVDEMADRYKITLQNRPDLVLLETQPREGATNVGDDVDVGIYLDHEALACEGGGGQTSAHESVSAVLPEREGPFNLTFRVGHMTNDCGSWSFQNNGPVEYTARISAFYGLGRAA